MRAFSRPVDAAPLSPRPRGHATLRPGRAGRCGAVTPFFPFISGGSEAGAGGVEDEADHEALLAHLAQTRRDDTVGSGIAKLIFDNLTGQAAAKAREAPLLCLQAPAGEATQVRALEVVGDDAAVVAPRRGSFSLSEDVVITPFLHATPTAELATVRKYSSLSSFAYLIGSVTESSLARSHKLRLVTTSLALKERTAGEAARAAERTALRRWLAEAALAAPAAPPPRLRPPPPPPPPPPEPPRGSAASAALLRYLPADAADLAAPGALAVAAEAFEGALGPGTEALNRAVVDILAAAGPAGPLPGVGPWPAARARAAAARVVRKVGAAARPVTAEVVTAARSANGVVAQLAAAAAPLIADAAAGSTSAALALAQAVGPLAALAASGSSVAAQALGSLIDPIASKAAAGGSAAGAALASITGSIAAAAASAATRVGGGARSRALREGEGGPGAQPGSLPGSAPARATCPCEWFVCDDMASSTRVFVIQGSDSVASWRSNLAFDPVVFEHPGLNTKVHRGVYEAAAALYDTLQPLIDDHLAQAGRRGRLAFTGHSLGGSIATLLLLLTAHRRPELARRGVLQPVYTFGAPSILCDSCCGDCAEARAAGRSAAAAAAAGAADGGEEGAPPPPPRGLLSLLGLRRDAVRNVIMHLDIVPRAFSCDYRLVQAWLTRLGGGFREHACLQPGRGSADSWESASMYLPVGTTMVLQPGEEAAAQHAMLPPGSGLYLIDDPIEPLWAATGVPWGLGGNGGGSGSEWGDEAADAGRLLDARAALSALLNSPHPLDILADVQAYGPQGTVSRYHNPFHYTRALAGEQRRRKGALRLGVERAAVAAGGALRAAAERVRERVRAAAPGQLGVAVPAQLGSLRLPPLLIPDKGQG